MNIKHLLTISLAVFLSACDNQNPPVQTNGSGYNNDYNSEYQNPPITNSEALAVGAIGVGTGYALSKYANKPKTNYNRSRNAYGKPVVVVNKHYYQTKPKVRVSRYKRK